MVIRLCLRLDAFVPFVSLGDLDLEVKAFRRDMVSMDECVGKSLNRSAELPLGSCRMPVDRMYGFGHT